MPKVGKVKLDDLGLYTGQTTYVGTKTIDMYYSFSNNKFSFKREDINTLGIGYEFHALHSKTRDKLISKLELIIGNCKADEKYLTFNVQFDLKEKITDNEIIGALTDYRFPRGEKSSSIQFSHRRCIKKTTLHTNEVHYLETDDDFKYDINRPQIIYKSRSVFIPYTESRERFLQSIVDGIKDVNTKLLDFVKGCENEDMLVKNIDMVSDNFLKLENK